MDYDAQFIRLNREVKELQELVAVLGSKPPAGAMPQQLIAATIDKDMLAEEIQKLMMPLTELKEQGLDRIEVLENRLNSLCASAAPDDGTHHGAPENIADGVTAAMREQQGQQQAAGDTANADGSVATQQPATQT